MAKYFEFNQENEDNNRYISIAQIVDSLGIDREAVDAMISGDPGVPNIGHGIEFRRLRSGGVGEFEISHQDYPEFERRLHAAEPEIKKYIDFLQKVEKAEKALYPVIAHAPLNVYEMGEDQYAYFKPSRHCRLGLFSYKDFSEFVADREKTMLVLGSGPGHLEGVLTHLGLQNTQIVSVDLNPSMLSHDSRSVAFDFHKNWPINDKVKFDLIIFPESLGVSLLPHSIKLDQKEASELEEDMFVDLMVKCSNYLKPKGQIRISTGIYREQQRHVEERIKPLKIVDFNEPILVIENK